MNVAPRDQWQSKFQKMVFDTSSLTFIYLRLLVEGLRMIKVRVSQNLKIFPSEHSVIFIHLMMHKIFNIR